ncbi:MAG: helix-turn-helix transcriptional regulator [Acidimicrobiales bacterium]
MLVRESRRRSGLSLRELGALAGTSHSTLAAYERRRKVPSAATLNRIVEAAGFDLDTTLRRRVRGTAALPRGDELEAVLDLAAAFPARHSTRLDAPVFGR